ncbi:hypothetical protein HAX54_017185 [Datura stramonium]|uniref:Uncharacterized protein n=1 Tax=Datura stramonium TaxID=4076 RepID=A0ABS8UMJ5_DATST|nr:hypothetical protein [Datura stramonium]
MEARRSGGVVDLVGALLREQQEELGFTGVKEGVAFSGCLSEAAGTVMERREDAVVFGGGSLVSPEDENGGGEYGLFWWFFASNPGSFVK